MGDLKVQYFTENYRKKPDPKKTGLVSVQDKIVPNGGYRTRLTSSGRITSGGGVREEEAFFRERCRAVPSVRTLGEKMERK